MALLTVELTDPAGYGRIVRDDLDRCDVSSRKKTPPAERGLREVNTGILAVPAAKLRGWVAGLGNDNAQGEYYLTDVVALAVRDDVPVEPFTVVDPAEAQGQRSPATGGVGALLSEAAGRSAHVWRRDPVGPGAWMCAARLAPVGMW